MCKIVSKEELKKYGIKVCKMSMDEIVEYEMKKVRDRERMRVENEIKMCEENIRRYKNRLVRLEKDLKELM